MRRSRLYSGKLLPTDAFAAYCPADTKRISPDIESGSQEFCAEISSPCSAIDGRGCPPIPGVVDWLAFKMLKLPTKPKSMSPSSPMK